MVDLDAFKRKKDEDNMHYQPNKPPREPNWTAIVVWSIIILVAVGVWTAICRQVVLWNVGG